MTSSIYNRELSFHVGTQNLLCFLEGFETPPLEQIAIPLRTSQTHLSITCLTWTLKTWELVHIHTPYI